MRLVAALALLIACNGKDDATDPAPADGDADTDADSDADADADADSDADTDTTPVRTIPADLADCVATVDWDQGSNGSVERTTRILYDAGGLQILIVVNDTDADTPAEVTLVRDANGNEIERRIDQNGDGIIDDVQVRTWSPSGYLTAYCVDFGFDGLCDYAERITYDSVTDLRSLYEQDADGDGLYESTCTYTYDGSDRRLSFTCDGPLNRASAYTYTGGTVYDYDQTVDLGRNATNDQRFSYRFDSVGRPTYAATDADNNGNWDNETNTAYNPDGTVDYVAGAIAAPSSTFRWEYVYDAVGYTVSSAFGIDVTGDGVPDNVDTEAFTWECPS